MSHVQAVEQRGYVSFDDACNGRIVDLLAGRTLEGRQAKALCDRSLLSAAD
ncbi:MAG: hypothetical protein ACRDOG_17740 [Gaiellaceae bacterium]